MHAKWDKILTVNFTDYLNKCDCFANYFKHKHTIICWKAFFIISMNLRPLPQNEALFRSDQLENFVVFVQKYMLMIQALSLGMEDTILTRRLRWTCVHPVSPSKLAEECRAFPDHTSATVHVRRCAVWAAAKLPVEVSSPSEPISYDGCSPIRL